MGGNGFSFRLRASVRVGATSSRRPSRWPAARSLVAIAGELLLALMLACALTATAAATASAAVLQAHEGTPNPTATAEMPGMTGDMPGMDHGTGGSEMPGMTGDIPGMDHGTGSSEMPGMTGDMPGMDHGTGGPAPDRPLGQVLGGFGAGSAAVMASAAFVRRRDLASNKTRQARIHTRKARS
jgi:uncharacterized protein involved in copper resistance